MILSLFFLKKICFLLGSKSHTYIQKQQLLWWSACIIHPKLFCIRQWEKEWGLSHKGTWLTLFPCSQNVTATPKCESLHLYRSPTLISDSSLVDMKLLTCSAQCQMNACAANFFPEELAPGSLELELNYTTCSLSPYWWCGQCSHPKHSQKAADIDFGQFHHIIWNQ